MTLQSPRGVLGPFGPKVGNGVENEFPQPSGPGAQKVKGGAEKESQKSWTLFLTFWAPGPEGPGNSFSTLFPTFCPKGPRTSLGGLKGRSTFVGDRYDWTTGAPHDGNEWKKYRVVPHVHPRVPFFMFILIGLEAKGLLAFQGRRGIASGVQWNPRPVIFGVDFDLC